MSVTPPFRFLDLPPEIREKIYILLSTNEQQPTYLSNGAAHRSYPCKLLRVSHQLYAEARFVYFTANRFCLVVTRHSPELLSTFLSQGFKDARRLLQRLDIVLERWGKGNWFVEKFLPAIEDCIMYGRLRELNIRVKRERGETMPKGEPALALKRILEDPYLENVKLEIYWFVKKAYEVRDWTWKLDRGSEKELGIVRGWDAKG